jgi:hypothetical protein
MRGLANLKGVRGDRGMAGGLCGSIWFFCLARGVKFLFVGVGFSYGFFGAVFRSVVCGVGRGRRTGQATITCRQLI